jgi:hypothetical protein
MNLLMAGYVAVQGMDILIAIINRTMPLIEWLKRAIPSAWIVAKARVTAIAQPSYTELAEVNSHLIQIQILISTM